MEPLLLSKLGTTPGKAIWGLVVRREDGEFPSYQEAFTRTLGVLYYGLAFNITFLELYTLYKSYKRADEKEQQPWEMGFSYRLKDERNYRPVLFMAAYALHFPFNGVSGTATTSGTAHSKRVFRELPLL